MDCFIIAEAGVNHNGSTELAHKLVEIAADAGADAIKFQTFKADLLAKPGAEKADYQRINTSSEGDQLEMLRALELSEEAHQELFRHCIDLGIEFMSTPFDIGSAKFLVDLGMKYIKIPSGELTNLPFINQLAKLNKPMILSTGMATESEVEDAISVIEKVRLNEDFPEALSDVLTVLHCTSNYPTLPEDINLSAMVTMSASFNLPVGYSDHTNGILIPSAAVALGAKVIEKHFTIDKSLPGPDHKASLEPDELKQMVADIRCISKSLGDGIKKPRPSELPVRKVVRRSITLNTDVKKGDRLSLDNLTLLRPGGGIEPKFLEQIIGAVLMKDGKAGDTLYWQDVVQ